MVGLVALSGVSSNAFLSHFSTHSVWRFPGHTFSSCARERYSNGREGKMQNNQCYNITIKYVGTHVLHTGTHPGRDVFIISQTITVVSNTRAHSGMLVPMARHRTPKAGAMSKCVLGPTPSSPPNSQFTFFFVAYIRVRINPQPRDGAKKY